MSLKIFYRLIIACMFVIFVAALVYLVIKKRQDVPVVSSVPTIVNNEKIQGERLGRILDVTEMSGKTILAVKFKKKIIMIQDADETVLPFEQEYSIIVDSNDYGKGYYLVSENAKVKCFIFGYKSVKE